MELRGSDGQSLYIFFLNSEMELLPRVSLASSLLFCSVWVLANWPQLTMANFDVRPSCFLFNVAPRRSWSPAACEKLPGLVIVLLRGLKTVQQRRNQDAVQEDTVWKQTFCVAMCVQTRISWCLEHLLIR